MAKRNCVNNFTIKFIYRKDDTKILKFMYKLRFNAVKRKEELIKIKRKLLTDDEEF